MPDLAALSEHAMPPAHEAIAIYVNHHGNKTSLVPDARHSGDIIAQTAAAASFAGVFNAGLRPPHDTHTICTFSRTCFCTQRDIDMRSVSTTAKHLSAAFM